MAGPPGWPLHRRSPCDGCVGSLTDRHSLSWHSVSTAFRRVDCARQTHLLISPRSNCAGRTGPCAARRVRHFTEKATMKFRHATLPAMALLCLAWQPVLAQQGDGTKVAVAANIFKPAK